MSNIPHEIKVQIEREATEWFSRQPMGSAVRNSGPAAIEGYIAGAVAQLSAFDWIKESPTK